MNRLQNIGLLKQTGKQWGLNGRTSQGVQLYTTQAKPTNNNFRKNMIKYSHPTSPLAGFNQRLALKLRSQFHNPRKTLDQVLEIIGEIKQQQLKLDIHSYNALLIAYARNRTHSRSVFDTLTEMREAGVEPNTDSYNAILDALSLQGAVTLQSEFKNEMIEKNIPLTTTTYYHLLRGMGKADALEFALNTLEDMKEKGVQPNIECYGILIGACLRLNESSAAFDLLKEAESMDLAVESQPRIYLDVLRVASNCDKFDAVTYCWDKAIGKYSMRPDEGTCLSVLNAAGKQGNTQLATDVIRQLSTSGFIYKEHYFTPLMEAFANKGDLKSAFNVLDIMRVSGIQPSMRSTLPIRRKLYKDIDAIDKAYYILEEMHKEGKAVDLTAFNVIIGACADAGDIERTVATYREAPHLGVQPNVDTYNTVLEACVKTRMQGMGNIVIKEMLSNNIKPNLETYSRMISLACTQKSYEDAFTYLEEMKGYDIVPPESCYTTLARKLASEKDPRFHLALEEMETFGYKVTPKVRGLWK